MLCNENVSENWRTPSEQNPLFIKYMSDYISVLLELKVTLLHGTKAMNDVTQTGTRMLCKFIRENFRNMLSIRSRFTWQS